MNVGQESAVSRVVRFQDLKSNAPLPKQRCVAPIAVQFCVSKSGENARGDDLPGGVDGNGVADQLRALGYDCVCGVEAG
jgi:hypothetical protein